MYDMMMMIIISSSSSSSSSSTRQGVAPPFAGRSRSALRAARAFRGHTERQEARSLML